MKMKLWEVLLLFFMIIFICIFLFVVKGYGDELLDACYEQLDMSNELIEELFNENEMLRIRIKNLETIITELRAIEEPKSNIDLLDQCYVQLDENNKAIVELEEKNKALNLLYSVCKDDLKSAKYRWQIGLGASHPIGGELFGGVVFKRFGLYSSAGYLNCPYIKLGFFLKK